MIIRNQKLRFSSFLGSFLFKALALSIFRAKTLFKIVSLA
ncbi:hypothetical protein HPHPP8B_0424 [Helicobacter pylori Hp P-8b]|nr:hypothetical protein HPHPP8_0423 [Helicobacter pylori Hp P-8]EJC27870.1 hypothetical protein HPHPP8B_0424 [Helicobacter pylori Hp P-8b]